MRIIREMSLSKISATCRTLIPILVVLILVPFVLHIWGNLLYEDGWTNPILELQLWGDFYKRF